MNPTSATQPFVFRAEASAGAGIARPPGPGQMVQDTRREISEIVREVATEARGERPLKDFLSFFADRLLRAMAAEGVVIWLVDHEDGDHKPLQRIGRISDLSIDPQSHGAHLAMIGEVARAAQPVIVPPTPGANDPSIPANPTEVPAAVVPIEGDAKQCEYLVEVFLDGEGGITTQRGYLRFVAQMADLAGEYLRCEQLRQLRSTQTVSRRVDQAIHLIHQSSNPRMVETQIVDSAAELFGFDRVGLCFVDRAHAKLAAVSHVNRIDQRSDGAKQIRSAAMMQLTEQFGSIHDPQNDHQVSGFVVAADDQDPIRLVAIGNEDKEGLDREELKRFLRHASIAHRNASKLHSIPGGRILAALAPASRNTSSLWWIRPIVTIGLLTALVVAMLFPIPMNVRCNATIAPAVVQQVTAPRDTIVQTLHVRHGQSVLLGEPLVTLVDPSLDQEITELLGRRAVLAEKRSRWNRMLVNRSSQSEEIQRLESEQALVREEIQGIDNELALLSEAQKGLVLRAQRSGIVDAWRIKQRLEDRPLTRGDLLLRVIGKDSHWVAEAQVPQNRIRHLRQSKTNGEIKVSVSLEAQPDLSIAGELTEIGPAVLNNTSGVPTNLVSIRLNENAVSRMATKKVGRDQSDDLLQIGAPSTVVLECGERPVLYVLFQDVIQSVRANVGLYLGPSNQGTDS